MSHNLLGEPAPTMLPIDEITVQEIASGIDPYDIARRHPSSPAAWALLSDAAWADGRVMESYAFARVGYHRGLDLLRRNGWKGHGAVPWSHEPNQGLLSCLRYLHRAAQAIGEDDEVIRLDAFMTECDPQMPRT
jgi:hypothetical protein